MNARLSRPARFLVGALVFAGGCVGLAVQMFPTWSPDPWGMVRAFFAGAALVGVGCAAAVKLYRTSRHIDALTADVRPDAVLPLSGQVRAPQGTVYGARRPSPFPVNDGRRSRRGAAS